MPNRKLYTQAVHVGVIGNDLALHNEWVVAKGLGAPIAAEGLRASAALKGAAVFGAAATAYDLATSAHRAWELQGQGNTVGAQSELLHFGARNVSGWAGAIAGAQAGAAAGIESGPGLLLTSIAGAGIGAWGGDKLIAWVEQHRINTQAGPDGNLWRFDPKRPDAGWTREVVDAFAERGLSARHTEVAPPAIAHVLDYQAATRAVQLRLATPDVPVNPYVIPADASDRPSANASAWMRDPHTRQWTREVTAAFAERGLSVTHSEIANPAKAAELDAYAQDVIAFNAARQPAAIAARYEQAYAQAGWVQQGAIPGAVRQAGAEHGRLQASDGSTFQRNAAGQWIHDGVLGQRHAEGNLRDELDATQRQFQPHAPNKQATPAQQAPAAPTPSASAPHAPPPAPSAPVQRTQGMQAGDDMRQQGHPGHASYQAALQRVELFESQQRIAHGPRTERLAAALAAFAESRNTGFRHTFLEKDGSGAVCLVKKDYGSDAAEQWQPIDARALSSQSIGQSTQQWMQARSALYARAAGPQTLATPGEQQALAQLPEKDQALFARIRRDLPDSVADAHVLQTVVAAKQSGITRAEEIGQVGVAGERMIVRGTIDTGLKTAVVDVSGAAPAMQGSVTQLHGLEQQRLQQLAQAAAVQVEAPTQAPVR